MQYPKRVFSIIIVFVLLIAPGIFAGEYSTAWQTYLAGHSQEQDVSGIITMTDQVDLRATQDHLYAIHADRQVWHETVVRALQEKATSTQADILAELANLKMIGQVSDYKALWVANIILVTALPRAYDRLVNRSDVLQISPDYPIEMVEPISKNDNLPIIANAEENLRAIHADSCWAIGITGEGRLISSLDTGVDGTHPAFADRWRGVADPRYADHPEWAWFDPVTFTDFPFDATQHGTHGMGIMTGNADGDTIGVAPGAQWISAAVIDRVSIQRTVQDALFAFQWTIDPDADPSTVWDVADVSCNGWGLATAHGFPPCEETFWNALDAVQAAGVVVIFGAGADGPAPSTIRRPADRATTATQCFSVGAVDSNNPNMPVADFSSRGPSNCTPDGSNTFKPEITAPGVDIRSSVPGSGYAVWSGTAAATAHVAGVVALMRQANPDLTSEQVLQILLDNAVDRGSPGDDNNYGMGTLDAFLAVIHAMEMPWGGFVEGIITDQQTGHPISGATITGSRDDQNISVHSRENGTYTLGLPLGFVWQIAVENSPSYLPLDDTVTVVPYYTTIRNYVLEPKVPVVLSASFGTDYLNTNRSFYMRGSLDSLGIYDSSWSGPLFAANDDGIAPDQVAGDGVFTCQTYLACDSIHTFNWGIYYKNVADSCYFLQNGAPFSVSDFTPPDVPTLSVNPSGNEHNWLFSVAGDHDLNFDLSPGYHGNQNRWGGICSLFVDFSYSFRFVVMNSNIGIPCHDSIHYQPEISGLYEFIFNEFTESYLIQPADTSESWIDLHAISGLDHHVLLSWGSGQDDNVESQEIVYDDGVLANAWFSPDHAAIMANKFVLSAFATIDSVMIHVLTTGDPYWPWPDPNPDPIGISIYLDNGNGFPQTDPVFYAEATGTLGNWIRIDIPEIAANGNFWVGMSNLDGGGEEALGFDEYTDHPTSKWLYNQGSWQLQTEHAGDQMIRAKVFIGDRSSWIGSDANSEKQDADIILRRSNESGLPSISNSELVGYHLYRDTLGSPWDRRPSTRVDCDPGIVATYYDDWCRCGGVDSIRNGITYYYQIGAIYDIGGGHYIEVGPSNQASATPQNQVPYAPLNLSGTVDNLTVHLHWSYSNPAYDLAHFSIFKRLTSDSVWIQTGISYDSSAVIQIPSGEDGLYAFAVSAIDNGTPPLESDLSNFIVLLIGNPPGCQYAVGDINGNGQSDAIDITFGVNYLKGRDIPPVNCYVLCPTMANPFYAAGDVNGSCEFNGVDITYFVGYLKGRISSLLYCPDCPPAEMRSVILKSKD